MTGRSDHVENRIQAFLDNELAPHEVERVRSHCAECPRCRKALEQAVAVRDILHADRNAIPLRPMWPHVRGRLNPIPSRRIRPAFALGVAAAGLAGILLGVSVGSIKGDRYGEAFIDTGYSTESVDALQTPATLSELYFSTLGTNGS